jgi:hypothetical protein
MLLERKKFTSFNAEKYFGTKMTPPTPLFLIINVGFPKRWLKTGSRIKSTALNDIDVPKSIFSRNKNALIHIRHSSFVIFLVCDVSDGGISILKNHLMAYETKFYPKPSNSKIYMQTVVRHDVSLHFHVYHGSK